MYQHPGVYIEHVPSNALSIEAASTSVTAIIGHARRGPSVTKDDGEPVFISSVAQYVSRFGGADGGAGGVKMLVEDDEQVPDLMGLAVNSYFANGGTKAYIVPIDGGGGAKSVGRLQIGGGAEATAANSITIRANEKGTWSNNLLAEMSKSEDTGQFELRIGTWALDTDGVTKKMDTVIERFGGLSMLKADHAEMKAMIDAASGIITVTFGGTAHSPADDIAASVEIDGGTDTDAPDVDDYKAALARLVDYRDISILLLPDVVQGEDAANDPRPSIYQAAVAHAEKMQNRMVVIDPGADPIITPKDAQDALFTNSPYAAFYYPRVQLANPHFDAELAPEAPKSFTVGPAAVAAGMWARIDSTRGVWKAPAGLEASVRGTFGPERLIGNAVQDNLNEWGVNCLRSIVGPTVIWGARTVATKAKPQYRYISVRRTQNMIGESLYNALQAVVFEPNDHKLWGGLRASVGNFMDGLHRAGAFQGEKASDAYYVNCGLGSTMTQGDIDAGIVRVAVGFAPLKPAEFVVVQISQKVGQAA